MVIKKVVTMMIFVKRCVDVADDVVRIVMGDGDGDDKNGVVTRMIVTSYLALIMKTMIWTNMTLTIVMTLTMINTVER